MPDLCHATLDLLIDGETGIWHLANQGAAQLARLRPAGRRSGAGYDPALVVADADTDARNTALASERGTMLRPLEQALAAYAARSCASAIAPADAR